MRKSLFGLCFSTLILAGCASTSSCGNTGFIACDQDIERQKSRSIELQKIVNEDQADRDRPVVDWKVVQPKDEARRKRVGEIFGEGCFKTSEDFAAAALVFQHGNIPDHFFQTYFWAKRAVELGDSKQKWLMAAGIDRYLVKSGRKQLFATQASKENSNPCWCMEEVELTFPDKLRLEYGKKSLAEMLDWIHSMNASIASCAATDFCKKGFKDSPVGSVPGFW